MADCETISGALYWGYCRTPFVKSHTYLDRGYVLAGYGGAVMSVPCVIAGYGFAKNI